MWLFRSGLFILAYVGMNIYTGIRIFALFRYLLPSLRALVFWPFYILFCFSFAWISFLRFEWLRPLRQAAMNSLPFLLYLFFGLILLDAVRLLLHFTGHIPRFGSYSAAATVIAMVFSAFMMVYGLYHARKIKTVNYSITLDKNLSGGAEQGSRFRIALVSDLHIGSAVNRKWVAEIVDALNRTEPDIICMAGDIFDNNIELIADLDGIAEELKRLNAPKGVYACQGNHDVDRLSFREEGSADRIGDFLKNADINFLLDEAVLVSDLFYLIGRRDARPIGGRQGRKTAAELVEGLGPGFDSTKPLIFMDHQPLDFPGEEAAGADLILSGHTHKGQIFPAPIITSRIYKEAGAVHYGYWQGRSARAVVTSGAGVWGPPIRIATNSEVAVIDFYF